MQDELDGRDEEDRLLRRVEEAAQLRDFRF
jgi:hypothetical protein